MIFLQFKNKMFDIGLIFIFQNIILLLLLFWVLSWLGEKFFKTKFYPSTAETYECGFLTITPLIVSINSSFFVIGFLLILYDLEFMFLIPFLFNLFNFSTLSFFIFWIFFILVTISFFIDWEEIALEWLIN